jgi:ubiquinone/menaquinone biosynthesis C-methylase UbiE
MNNLNSAVSCDLVNTYDILEHVMGMSGLHPHRRDLISNLRHQLVHHIENLVIPHNGVVLDIGCGSGSGTAALAKLIPGVRVIGVDINSASLDAARSRYDSIANLDFYHGDFDSYLLDFADMRIMGVICISVSMFIRDIEGFYRKIYDALDSRGILIDAPFIFTSKDEYPHEQFQRATYAMCGCNMRMLQITQLKDMARDAGFRNVSHRESGFDLMNLSVLFSDYPATRLFSNFIRNIISPPASIRHAKSWYLLKRTVRIFTFFFSNRQKYGSGELVAIKH